MLYIHDTVSLCGTCYRHVPAVVFERDNQIWMKKRCPLHGESEVVIEKNKDFYYSLDFSYFHDVNLLFEITDKCQLECPHCYHLPDNKTQDRPLEDILSQVSSFPIDCKKVLAGAEPSLRTDFVGTVNAIRDLPLNGRYNDDIRILTNGIRFSGKSFAESAFNAGLNRALIGLNHVSYNGSTSHELQLIGIKNLIDIGYHLPYVGYTIETLDHIPDILKEIEQINNPMIGSFRIRCGAFIGRSSDKHRSYLSDTIEYITNYVGKENISFIPNSDNNIYHVNLFWKGIRLRVIQWPDHHTVDMEELNMGPYSQFYGKPITNFVHQVIIRDAYKNMKMPLYDGVPYRYTYYGDKTYWKNNFSGPRMIDEYDYSSNILVKNKVPQF